MIIRISEKVVSMLKYHHIPMNEMGSTCIVLTALYNGEEDILDLADDNNKEKTALLLYEKLRHRGFIERTNESGVVLYELTELGEKLAKLLYESIEEDLILQVNQLDSENPETWIEEYIDLFPEGRPFGRPYRIGKSVCLPKMIEFLKTHNADKKIILAATKQWIDFYRNNEGFEKMRDSRYFIKKKIGTEIVSDLETAIGLYKDNLKNPIADYNTNLFDIV